MKECSLIYVVLKLIGYNSTPLPHIVAPPPPYPFAAAGALPPMLGSNLKLIWSKRIPGEEEELIF